MGAHFKNRPQQEPQKQQQQNEAVVDLRHVIGKNYVTPVYACAIRTDSETRCGKKKDFQFMFQFVFKI